MARPVHYDTPRKFLRISVSSCVARNGSRIFWPSSASGIANQLHFFVNRESTDPTAPHHSPQPDLPQYASQANVRRRPRLAPRAQGLLRLDLRDPDLGGERCCCPEHRCLWGCRHLSLQLLGRAVAASAVTDSSIYPYWPFRGQRCFPTQGVGLENTSQREILYFSRNECTLGVGLGTKAFPRSK